ncbi:MAG: AAA domain-containing protein, partial [bacterium]|nr:AAA domain-containing protein [bacterium]
MKQIEEENTYIENSEQEDAPLIKSVDSKQRKFISAEAQNKIVRLFTYLEKALALDNSVVRDFRTTTTAPSPWWLADYPRDVDNLYIRPFDTEKIVDSPTQTSAWLKVEKKNIKSAPDLPSELIEWINEVNPVDIPKAKEKIDRKVRFDNDSTRIGDFKKFRKEFKQGDVTPESISDWVILLPNKLPEVIEIKYVEDRWIEHPELEKSLSGYIENEWKPWAEKVCKIYKANILYDQLYALRLLLKNEGDSYELLLGQGLLTWKHQAVGNIYAPIFLTPLTLDFDASKRTIEISPDPMFRGFVEISSLYETDNPAEMDLITWSDKINADPFDFWHLETLKVQSQTLINYISTESEDRFGDDVVSVPEATKTPSIWNSPVIFARKRNNDLWSKYAGIIRRDIEQNSVEPTEFITDLVGEYKEEGQELGLGSEENFKDVSIKESELFFPLPWNDEQKRIAERLDANYGVVVKGPPGTGKSHTIANLISRFLAQGKSVLVTSQTSKALEVLRDKLPENIRSLAVSQLHQTAKRDDVLQQSISEISSNLGERHTKFSESHAGTVRKELTRVREEKASLANQIRKYILTDSNEKIEIDGKEIKPIEAAKLISEHADHSDLAWFTDKINFDTQLNFSEEGLREAYQLLLDLESGDRNLFKFELPIISSLPNEDVVFSAFASYRELSTKAKVSNKVFGNSEINLNQESFSKLWEMLLNARKILVSINKDYEQEIFDTCSISKNEREKWGAVFSKILERIQIIGKSKNKIIGHDISGKTSLSLNDFLEAIDTLKVKVSNKAKLSTFGKLLLSANAKRILESYTVDGRLPDNSERVEILREVVLAQIAEKEIQILLDQSFSILKTSPELQKDHLDLIQLEVLIVNLQRLTNYHEDFLMIDSSFKKVKQLADLSFTKKSDIESAVELIASHVAKFEITNLENSFSEWISILESVDVDNRHEITGKLIEAIQKRNTTGWKNAFTELILLIDKRSSAVHLNEIAEKIKKYSPNLYQDITDLADQKQKFECPDNLNLAWKISRLGSWLDNIHNHINIDSLQSQLERLTKREHELNSDLVTVLAWQRQIDKVTKRQRDALMAWSDAMRKYGKGTGKYANRWLHAAQDSLKEAKNAVPVWIMPLHRAAQMFSEPKAGMFDVVIFDEASQCDIRGLTIGYLGKKLLVVGDPDQISPAGIFQDLEKTFELISRFLSDIPHKDNFSITSSLFDLAKIRIPNMIQLNEHFRCVPEIIAFSNRYIYDLKLKPLRHPHPKGLLKPALIPVFIEGGYQNTNNKVNEPEAKAIVEKLVECLNDPNYQKRPDGRLCTFGIISLLAEDQAKYIKDLILRHPQIGEKIIEERKITCGDAYAFQGDERDVMFLSMVKALDPNNPDDTVKALTDKGTAQRFNVAA